MNQLTRGIAAVVLATVLSTVTAGCSASEPPPKPVLEKTSIKVAVFATADAAPLFLAVSKGYFKEEGLEVLPTIATGGGTVVPMTEAGQVDLAQTDYVSLIMAASHGKRMKVVGSMAEAGAGSYALVVRDDSPIRSVKDLKGKSVAVNNLNGFSTLAVGAMLTDSGLDNHDVKFIERPFPDMKNALTHGKIDAAWLAEPFISDGAPKLRQIPDTVSDRIRGLPVGGWIATDEWREENPQTLAAFQRAIAKAQRLAAGDRKEVEKMLPTYMKIGRETAEKTILGTYPTTMDPRQLQRVADFMQQNRYLKAPVDVKTFIASG
ncbi:ABC transporter substrate-binding protein [Nonomuraea rosea]|uniref:ABC transporter substrate-binding protein n=1 Tax=Nonomuraea rosea TaxID=638574 RepID=A0ABP6VI48_9ACTN